MSKHGNHKTVTNMLDNRLEMILEEDRREMVERKQMILHGLTSHALEAKKDVHHHISQLVKIEFDLLNSTKNRKPH